MAGKPSAVPEAERCQALVAVDQNRPNLGFRRCCYHGKTAGLCAFHARQASRGRRFRRADKGGRIA